MSMIVYGGWGKKTPEIQNLFFLLIGFESNTIVSANIARKNTRRCGGTLFTERGWGFFFL